MSQAQDQFGQSGFQIAAIPKTDLGNSSATEAPASRPLQPEFTEDEKREMEKTIKEVRERWAKNPNPKWLTTEDVLRLIDSFEESKESA